MVPPNAHPPDVSDAVEAEDAQRRMIRNEQRKLEAMFINNIGVAVVVTGAITPLLANLYGLSSAPALSWLTNGWLVPILLVAGFALNALAVRWLKDLE